MSLTNKDIEQILNTPSYNKTPGFSFEEINQMSWIEAVKNFNKHPEKYGIKCSVCKICGNKFIKWIEIENCPYCGSEL